MTHRRNYTVQELGKGIEDLTYLAEGLGPTAAVRVAKDAATSPGKFIYIQWIDMETGERGYLNKSGESPVGEKW